MTLKEALPILQAISDGAEWEWKDANKSVWHNREAWANGQWACGECGSGPISALYYAKTLRIKPAPAPPEYVPLCAADVPPGSAVRHIAAEPYKWELVLEACPKDIYISGKYISMETLSREYEILRPGATAWEPCKKLKQ